MKNQNENCLRNQWKNKDSIHIGCLYIYSSGRAGGGIMPSNCKTDHIPTCKPVYWSCCHQESLAEGCTQLYEDNLSIDYCNSSTNSSKRQKLQ